MTPEISGWYCKTCDIIINLGDEDEMLKHTDHKLESIDFFDIRKPGFNSLWCYLCKKQTSTKLVELAEHYNHIISVGKDKRTAEEIQDLVKNASTKLRQQTNIGENKEQFENLDPIHKATILDFAHNVNILQIWVDDLNKVHVGDEKNKVLAGILLVSSKRAGHEQAIIIQKLSSAGGSNLQNSTLEYFDDKIQLTRMTGAYLDRSGIDYTGKILAIGEMSGFDSASSSLRQKLSEGKTELATTDKNEKGKLITEIIRTEGKPSFITTTTSLEIHPELENRCWILSIDETQNQTKAINKHQFSKDTFEYEEWKPSSEIKELINSGVLKDHKVVNPFAHVLGEQFPYDNVTARRDSKRFADLTTTITYIHQYQRIKIRTRNQPFLLTSYRDLELALYYGENALKNTLNKLDKKAESILEYMKMNKEKGNFTRNDLCSALDIPYETMKRLLRKLVGRSFVELEEEDRIWKYKLSNKVMIGELSFGGSDFEKSALEYLSKHASNFEQIIMPPNYKEMTGIDKVIVDYLLSFNGMVTGQNGESLTLGSMPITTSPLVLVTGTNPSEGSKAITNPKDFPERVVQKNEPECINPVGDDDSASKMDDFMNKTEVNDAAI